MAEFTGEHPVYVVLRREDLFEFLGRVGLPPWEDERGRPIGERVNCAPLAQEMIDWVEQNEISLPDLFRLGLVR